MKRRTFLQLISAAAGAALVPMAACSDETPAASFPADVVTESASLWVADELSLTLDRAGRVLTGYDADGQVIWRYDGLNGATAVAVTSGTIYVVDSGHAEIVLLDEQGALLDRWSFPEAGCLHGIAIADGAIYVSDTARRRVIVLDRAGRERHTLGEGRLTGPRGLAWHAGVLYVADAGRGVVDTFDANGVALRTFGESLEMLSPRTIAVRANGAMVVVDPVRRELYELSSEGVVIDAYRPELPGAAEVNVYHAVVAQDGSLWVHAELAA